VNFLYIFCASAALILIQCLLGGTRMLFSFPAYALIGAAAALSVVSLRRPGSTPSLGAVFTAIALATYAMVRASFSPVAYLAWPDLAMAAACLCLYLLSALFITEPRYRLWIVGVLLAIAAVEIGVGVIQFGRDQQFMLFGFIRPGTETRAGGMFISGNHLAGYLEAVALLGLALVIWGRWPLTMKMLAGYLTAMCYLGVVISGSRGGCISSAFSLLIFSGLCIRVVHIVNPRKTLLVLVLGILAVVTVGIFAYNSRVVARSLNQNAAKDIRVYNWAAALDQFRLAPWFGTGAGTHLYYGREFRRPQLQADPVHAHGDYLELLAEYGVAGELLALVFLFAHLRSGLAGMNEIAARRLRNPIGRPRSDALALTLGSLGAVAALMAHSVVDFNMHIPGNALVFSFLFGILANPGAERATEPPKWLSAVVLLRMLAFPLGVAVVALVVPRIKGEWLSEQARVALRENNYSQCLPLAKQAIAAQPLNFHNYFYFGEANRAMALNLGMPGVRPLYFQKAANSFREGLKVFPQDESLMVRYAQALDGVGQYGDAERAYRNAIELDPNLGVLYAYYAAHLHFLGAYEEEKKSREKAASLANQDVSSTGMDEVDSLLDKRPRR